MARTLYSSNFGTQAPNFTGLGAVPKKRVKRVEAMYDKAVGLVQTHTNIVPQDMRDQAYADFADFAVWKSRHAGDWPAPEFREWRERAESLLHSLEIVTGKPVAPEPESESEPASVQSTGPTLFTTLLFGSLIVGVVWLLVPKKRR